MPGDEVIVTGYELGAGQWGGWSQRIRVLAEWVVPKPQGLSLFETMVLGTAGFTAAQCALALKQCDIKPEAGEVLVTGASGGVGSLSVKLLSQLGYSVVASTGKLDQAGLLVAWGAKRVIDREDLSASSPKPLLSARWASAVDTVGGEPLTRVIRETHPYGCVAACGLVAGADLNMTVMPFLIRGITLAGIASAMCPYDRRLEIWRLLSSEWKIENLKEIATTVPLADVRDVVARISKGEVLGRTVVQL
jgi:putative YhdH/YhfP family quinone oxidoreductase